MGATSGSGEAMKRACLSLAAWTLLCLPAGCGELEPAVGPMVGKPAKKIADSVEFWVNGPEVELAKLEGKAVLLVFWHPDDEGRKSLAALPGVRKLADAYAARGLLTIGSCVLDGPQEVGPLLREHQIAFRIALDCDADLHKDYRIDKTGTPYAYLIDAKRTIVWEGPPEKLSSRRIRNHLP
jgi:hypothetical protein